MEKNKSEDYNKLLVEITELKKQNQQLSDKIKIENNKNKHIYKLVFNNSDDLISLIDKDYKFLLVNDTFLKHHLKNRNEVIGKNLVQVLGNDDFNEILKLKIDSCFSGKSVNFQRWFISYFGNQKKIFLDINYSPVFDNEGRISSVLISARDITNYKYNQDNNLELSSIVEQASEAIIKTDKKFRITYLNKASEELYGWSLNEVYGKPATIFFEVEKSEKYFTNLYNRILKNKETLGVSLNKTKLGTIFYSEFKISSIFDANNNHTGYVGFVRDITEKKVAEQKIKHDREYLQNLISSMRDLMFVFDKNGFFVDYNRPDFDQDLYAEPEFFINKHYRDVMPRHINEEIEKIFEKFKNGAEVVSLEYELELNKVKRNFSAKFSKLTDDKGTFKGALSVVRDITDKVEAENKLKKSEQRYKQLVDNSPDIIYKYSLKNGVLFCSESAKKNIGYNSKELCDNPFLWVDSILEKYKAKRLNAIKLYENGLKSEIQYQFLTKNGKIKWINDVFTFKTIQNNEIIIEGHASDITKIKEAELEIIERKDFIKSILENMPSTVFVHDIDGKLTVVNKKTEHELGYSKPELLKMNISEINTSIKNNKNIWLQLTNNKTINLETFYKRKNGEVFPVEVYISSIYIKNKKYFLTVANNLSEKKLAQISVKESEQKLKMILNSFVDPVYIVNENLQIEYMNDALKDKLLNRDENNNVYCYEILYNTKEKCNDCFFDHNNSVKNYSSLDLDIKHWNKIHSVTNVPLPDKSQLRIHFDITERKRGEEILRQNERQQRYYNEFLSKGIQKKNSEEICSFVSVSLNKMFPELITIFSNVNEEEKTSTIKNIKGVNQLVLDKVDEIAGFKLIGTEFPIFGNNINEFYSGKLIEFKNGLSEFSNSIFTEEKTKGVETYLGINKTYAIGLTYKNKLYAIIRFLTLNDFVLENKLFVENFVKQIGIVIERKNFEIELKKSEEKYRLTVNNYPDIIVAFYKEKMISISPSFFDILGVLTEEFKDASVSDFFNIIHPNDREEVEKEYVQSLLKKDVFKTYEYRVLDKFGRYYWVEQRGSRKFNESGELELSVISIRDITERKNAEKKLKELIATKDKFFNIIAHDLRSPFSSILGLSSLLKEKSEKYDDKELSDYVKYLDESAHNTFNLLENLLTWAKSQTNRLNCSFENQDLNQLVVVAFNNLKSNADNKNISINNEIAANVTVNVDVNMIITVLRNIINNAIKFTENNGRISISAKTDNTDVVVIIKDNGIGIEDDRIENLFKIDKNISTYGTNDEVGTGLGLILCKEFIEKHNGKIWAESELNIGSTFYFTIPISK